MWASMRGRAKVVKLLLTAGGAGHEQDKVSARYEIVSVAEGGRMYTINVVRVADYLLHCIAAVG
jgi:hypothetical protein